MTLTSSIVESSVILEVEIVAETREDNSSISLLISSSKFVSFSSDIIIT